MELESAPKIEGAILYGLPDYESRECTDCGGTGEESFCTVGSICDLCVGIGRLNWVEPWNRKKVCGTWRP